MNTEKIALASKEHAEKLAYKDQWINAAYQLGFRNGVTWASQNLDAIGAVSMEDAMKFNIWYHCDDMEHWYDEVEGAYRKIVSDERLTFIQLFQIFKQQKP